MDIQDIGPKPDLKKTVLTEKPLTSIQEEYNIRDSLIAQGVEREVAEAIPGYKPEDIPFVYGSSFKKTLLHGGGKTVPGESALWIGTTDAIHNLVQENGWNDQIPEVVVQWRGHSSLQEGKTVPTLEITRTEIRHISDGRFVEVQYAGVSDMGAFDGTISQIALHVPEEKFIPMGYTKERDKYRIYYFSKRKASEPEGRGGSHSEWGLQDGVFNVSGTTILNGFQDLLNYHMADVMPMKEDYRSARRFSPLLEVEKVQSLPISSEQQFQLAMAEQEGLEEEKVMVVADEAKRLVETIAPHVLEKLQKGGGTISAIQMEVDGILNHPDKIWILQKRLDQFSREQRFAIARVVAKMIQEGHFTTLTQALDEPQNEKFVRDSILTCTRQLLAWMKRTAPPDADLKAWIERARAAADAASEGAQVHSKTARVKIGESPAVAVGANPSHSAEYVKVYQGMISSFVERYVEYMGQQYFRNTLEEAHS